MLTYENEHAKAVDRVITAQKAEAPKTEWVIPLIIAGLFMAALFGSVGGLMLLTYNLPTVVIPSSSQVLAVRRVSYHQNRAKDLPFYTVVIEHSMSLEDHLEKCPEDKRWADSLEKNGRRPEYVTNRLQLNTSEFQAKRAEALWNKYNPSNFYNGPPRRFVVNTKGEWLQGFYPAEL